MYDGGVGNNGDCPSAGAPGCWGHRHNILDNTYSVGGGYNAYMGAAGAENASYATIMVEANGSPVPTDEGYTWAQAQGSGVATPPPACSSSTLSVNQTLSPGQCLVSPNGQYELTFSPPNGTGSYLEVINASNGQQLWTSIVGQAI